jgi:hypothetical protein
LADDAIIADRFSREAVSEEWLRPSQIAPAPVCASPDRFRRNGKTIDLGIAVTGRYARFDNPARNDAMFFEYDDYPPKCDPSQKERSEYDLGARVVQVRLPLDELNRPALTDQRWLLSSFHGAGQENVLRIHRDGGPTNFENPTAVPYFENGAGLQPFDGKLTYLGNAGGDALFELTPLPIKPKAGSYKVRVFLRAGTLQGWSNEMIYTGPWKTPPPDTKSAAVLSGAAGSKVVVSVAPDLVAGTRIDSVQGVLFGDHQALITDRPKSDGQNIALEVIVPVLDVPTVDVFAQVTGTQPDPDPQFYVKEKSVTGVVKIGVFTYKKA